MALGGNCYDSDYYCLEVYEIEIKPVRELTAAREVALEAGEGASRAISNMLPVDANQENVNQGGDGSQVPEEPNQAVGPRPFNQQRIRRIRFTPWQRQELERVFQQTQYPDAFTRRNLAIRIGVTDTKVQVWFKNKRAKCRRNQRELMLVNAPPAEPEFFLLIVMDDF
ncbi:rhox homeobox family member 1 [Carlito syrichta]|uniref:Rhox homeobox family member 1 n=1 Tax=Carlito syrichta TaxID=1868482 RepID=A0A1U7TI37_CARSF|nr:rhox homeobox family member 1 [Carlito syrichta]